MVVGKPTKFHYNINLWIWDIQSCLSLNKLQSCGHRTPIITHNLVRVQTMKEELSLPLSQLEVSATIQAPNFNWITCSQSPAYKHLFLYISEMEESPSSPNTKRSFINCQTLLWWEHFWLTYSRPGFPDIIIYFHLLLSWCTVSYIAILNFIK